MLLHAIRKSDMKRFTPKAKDVCRVEDGNTNPYLQPHRAIEEFLAQIEPRYNWAINKFVRGEIDREAIYVIAGIAASTMVCSPGGMRIMRAPMVRILELAGQRLDRLGKFPRPPDSLGGSSFTKLLDEGKINVSVDPKHPQAFGILSILELIKAYGNFSWEILVNVHDDSPFFTSDYPVAIEQGSEIVIDRIFPLTPFMAVRIRPDRYVDLSSSDFYFKNFRCRARKVSRFEVRHLNRLFVRCAEDLVFHTADLPWIVGFVEKNAGYQIAPVSHIIPHGEGTIMANTIAVTAGVAGLNQR
jgi:hypothetical protein